MKLYIIRHGKTEANARKLFAGASDWPLSEEGKSGLRALKEEFDYSIPEDCLIVTSGLKRTEDTLQVFYGGVDHIKDPRLKERSFGIFEDRTLEEIQDLPEFKAWTGPDSDSYVIPEGESFDGLKERVLEALCGYLQSDRNTLLVIHGGPVRVIMKSLFPGGGNSKGEWQPENGRGYVISAEGGKALSYESFPPKKVK